MTLVTYGFGTVKNVQSRTFGQDNDRVSYRANLEAFDGSLIEFDAGPDDPSPFEGKLVFFSGRVETIKYKKKDTGEDKTFNVTRLGTLKELKDLHPSQQPNTPDQQSVGGDSDYPDDGIPF
jgi:hypothetical protein